MSKLAELSKQGKSVRLNFKVGYLIIKSGVLSWQQTRELRHLRGGITSPINTLLGGDDMDDLTSFASSKRSTRYSVITPSLAQFTRATSNGRNFNAANPNPQQAKPSYQGVREMNKSAEETKKMLETVKFGKKMVFGQMENNHDVLEEHLRQMRNNVEGRVNVRANQIAAD